MKQEPNRWLEKWYKMYASQESTYFFPQRRTNFQNLYYIDFPFWGLSKEVDFFISRQTQTIRFLSPPWTPNDLMYRFLSGQSSDMCGFWVSHLPYLYRVWHLKICFCTNESNKHSMRTHWWNFRRKMHIIWMVCHGPERLHQWDRWCSTFYKILCLSWKICYCHGTDFL